VEFRLLQSRLIEHLRERVRSGELTERSLARMTGVSQPHIHNVLKGIRLLSPAMADHVLENLRMQVLDLFQPAELASHQVIGRSAPPASFPVLVGVLGPGYPFPAGENPAERFPALPHLAQLLQNPAAARLGEDPRLPPAFQEGDLVLLDRSETHRRHPVAGGYYAIQRRGEGLVRRLRRKTRLFLLTGEGDDSSTWDYISLLEQNILEVIQAKVLWIGRDLEPSPFVARKDQKAG
jgi:hypothetical protein